MVLIQFNFVIKPKLHKNYIYHKIAFSCFYEEKYCHQNDITIIMRERFCE